MELTVYFDVKFLLHFCIEQVDLVDLGVHRGNEFFQVFAVMTDVEVVQPVREDIVGERRSDDAVIVFIQFDFFFDTVLVVNHDPDLTNEFLDTDVVNVFSKLGSNYCSQSFFM